MYPWDKDNLHIKMDHLTICESHLEKGGWNLFGERAGKVSLSFTFGISGNEG